MMAESSLESGAHKKHLISIRGSKCLVTGGGGFLGSYIVDKLKERGAAVVFAPRSREVDLCNDAECRTLFSLLRPDYVFHVAAEVGGIAANKENPGRYFYANMKMTLNVIECSREFGVKKLVHTGSVSSYPAKAPMPLKEVPTTFQSSA
jgi:GDP-L-fucose synthase